MAGGPVPFRPSMAGGPVPFRLTLGVGDSDRSQIHHVRNFGITLQDVNGLPQP